jgi:hypothetical protein
VVTNFGESNLISVKVRAWTTLRFYIHSTSLFIIFKIQVSRDFLIIDEAVRSLEERLQVALSEWILRGGGSEAAEASPALVVRAGAVALLVLDVMWAVLGKDGRIRKRRPAHPRVASKTLLLNTVYELDIATKVLVSCDIFVVVNNMNFFRFGACWKVHLLRETNPANQLIYLPP